MPARADRQGHGNIVPGVVSEVRAAAPRAERSRTPTPSRDHQGSIVGTVLSEARAAAARAAASQHAPLLTGARSSVRPGPGEDSPAPRQSREEIDESILQAAITLRDIRRSGDQPEDARHLNSSGAASQAVLQPTSNMILRHERAQADRATRNWPLRRPAQMQPTGEAGRGQPAGTILNHVPPSQVPSENGRGQLTGSELSRPVPGQWGGQGAQGQPRDDIGFRPYSAGRAGQGAREQPPSATLTRPLLLGHDDQAGQGQPLDIFAPGPTPPRPAGEGVFSPPVPVRRPVANWQAHEGSRGQSSNNDPTRPFLIRLPQDIQNPWLRTAPSAPSPFLPAEQYGRGPLSSTTLAHPIQTQMTAQGGGGQHLRNNSPDLIRAGGSQGRAATEVHSPSTTALGPTSLRSGASRRGGSGAGRSLRGD